MGILFVTMIWKDQSCIFGSWCISFIWNLNFSLGLSYTERWTLLSPVWLFATPWTVQYMEFSSLEYWSGKPFPSPGDLLNPGIKPRSPTLQADSLPLVPPGNPGTSSHLAKILHLPSSLEIGASLIAQLVKNPPAMQETLVQFMVRKIPGEGIGYPLQYPWSSVA